MFFSGRLNRAASETQQCAVGARPEPSERLPASDYILFSSHYLINTGIPDPLPSSMTVTVKLKANV